MRKSIFLLVLSLLAFCADSYAQLSQKEKTLLENSVRTNFIRNGAEGSQIYKTKSGYEVLVTVVKVTQHANNSYQEASAKAQRMATEFIVGAENRSVSVYSMQSSNSYSSESLSDRIIQSSLGQVREMQDLEEFQDNEGKTVYVKYLVLSKTNAKRGWAGVMSMVIPGSGQFYKGKTAKGCMFLGLTLAAAAGALVCESTRSSYIDKKNKELSTSGYGIDPQVRQKNADEYQSRADKWETGRNICIGVAGAIYVWNVLDAFFGKSAQRAVVTSKHSNLTFSPKASLNNVGVSFAYNF